MNSPQSFYAGLTQYYHLIYPDWESSIRRQASQLDSVIRECWGADIRSVLDASCGIGTQALGLAPLEYSVTGSDLSAESIARARTEARQRNLEIDLKVCDMRQLSNHFTQKYDIVISCDNSVPHLLTDEDILGAFREFWHCTRHGGGCLITVRDYEKEDVSQQQVKPYGIREVDGARWLVWQVWEPNEQNYDVTMYLVEDRGQSSCQTHVFRSTYYPIKISRLMELLVEAGFDNVRRIDDRFYQPILIGTRNRRQSAATTARRA